MMPMAMLAPKGLALLALVTVLAVFAWVRFYKEPLRLPRASFLLPFAAFVAYAVLSSAWSPTPLVSLDTSVKLGLMTFGGLALVSFANNLEATERKFLARALVIGALITLVLFGVEKLTDVSIWRWIMALKAGEAGIGQPTLSMVVYNPATSVGALFIWPLFLYWLGGRRMFAITGVLLATFIVFWSEAETPTLAILLGVLTAFLFWRARTLMRTVLGGGVIILMFAAPLIPGLLPGPETIRAEMPYLSHSAIMRLTIWKVAVKHIIEDPVAGLGMDTSRSLYGKETRFITNFPPPNPGGEVWQSFFEPIPLHPHNGILQIWLELGGIGIAGLVWIVITLMRAGERRRGYPLIAGFYVSSLTIASLSFGAWQNWWVSSLWLAATLLVAQLPPTERQLSDG